ncbi:MAG: hypothetical protein RIS90_2348 [Pseudomonadota bacterium]|jgi:uncharacterized protein (DUF924 family)
MTAQTVLDFWFKEIDAKQWWTKSAEFDQLIMSRFGRLHAAAARCELHAWRETAPGRLAEIIVLDQFSRNMYRDQARAFACDALALALAQTAVAAGADAALEIRQRAFLYMPYMHSESPLIHGTALALFSQTGLESSLRSEHQHKAIIDRFGRYPHRNAILGRPSTADEIAFLATPDSSF